MMLFRYHFLSLIVIFVFAQERSVVCLEKSPMNRIGFIIENRYFESVIIDVEVNISENVFAIRLVRTEGEKDSLSREEKKATVYKVGYDELLVVRLVERYTDGNLCWRLGFDVDGNCFAYEEYERNGGKDFKYRLDFNREKKLKSILLWDPEGDREYRYRYGANEKVIEVKELRNGVLDGRKTYTYLSGNRSLETFYDGSNVYKGYREVRWNIEEGSDEGSKGDGDLLLKEALLYDVEDNLVRNDFYIYSDDRLILYEENKNLFHVYQYGERGGDVFDEVLLTKLTRDFTFERRRIRVRYYYRPETDYDSSLFEKEKDLRLLRLTERLFWDTSEEVRREEIVTFKEDGSVDEVFRGDLVETPSALTRVEVKTKEIIKRLGDDIYWKLTFLIEGGRNRGPLLIKKEIFGQENIVLGTYRYQYDDLNRLVREDFEGSEKVFSKSILYYYRDKSNMGENPWNDYLNSYGREGFYMMGRSLLEAMFYDHFLSNGDGLPPEYEVRRRKLRHALRWVERVGFSKVVFLDSKNEIIRYNRLDFVEGEGGSKKFIVRYYGKPSAFYYEYAGDKSYYEKLSTVHFKDGASKKQGVLPGSEVSRSDFLRDPKDVLDTLNYKEMEFLLEKIVFFLSASTGEPTRAKWFKYDPKTTSLIEEVEVKVRSASRKDALHRPRKIYKEYLRKTRP